jgi:hypothetical protein
MTSDEYTIEQDGRDDIAFCDCCGNGSVTVWGRVKQGEEVIAYTSFDGPGAARARREL